MKCPKCGQAVKDVHFRYVRLQQDKSDEDEARMAPCGCEVSRGDGNKEFLALEKAKGKLNTRKRSPFRCKG